MSLNQGEAVASSSSQQEDVSWGDDEPAPAGKQSAAAKKKAAKQKAAAAAAAAKKDEDEAQLKQQREAEAAAAEAASAAKAAEVEQLDSPPSKSDLSASPVFASVTPALDSPCVPPPSSSAPAFTPTPEPTLEPTPQPSAVSHSRRPSQSPDDSVMRNVSVATPHPHSHIELIDWKLAENKAGNQFITFLFELYFLYDPATLRHMQQAHSQMISTRRSAAEAAAAAAAGEVLDSPPASQSAPFPSSVTLVVSKRFSELHSFHSLLERHFVCLPPFPSKTLGKNFDKDFIDSRCMTLTNYLQQIMLREDIMKTGWFSKFMNVPSPAQQLRTARAALHAQMRDGARKQQEQAMAGSRQRAPSTAAITSSSSSTSYARRHDSAFEDAPATAVDAHHHAVEVEAASTAVGTPVTQSERHLTEEEEHGFEEDHSSEPNTRSASVAAGAHDSDPFASGPITLAHAGGEMSPAVLVEGPSIDDMGSSDDEYDSKFNDPTNEIERDGRRVPVVPERRKADSRHAHHASAALSDPADASLSDLNTARSASSCVSPSSVALEFISRSPMFSMLKTILVDPSTLLCCAADQSTVAKVDSWLSSLFGGKKGDAVAKKQNVTASSSATFTSSSASAEISNPLGALYAFRRANVSSGSHGSVAVSADDDFAQSLHIFFPRELTGMEWDNERRWIYVVDNKGGLTIFNPSPDFDYSVKILHLQIFSDSAPITHLKFVPTLGSGSLLLTSAPSSLTSTSKQLVTRFDLHSQSIVHGTSFQFNSRDGPNKYEEMQAIEFDTEQSRLFIASQGKIISIYDMDNSEAAAAASASAPSGRVKPPALLHRLLNGHEGAVKCLALDAHNSLLASGGADSVLVLWNLGPRGAERTTSIWARLHGHTAKVTTVAFAAAKQGGAAASRLLVSGDSDGHVCVWDTRRRGCVLAFRAHSSAVLSVQLTASGTLVTASEDKSAKLWQLS